MYQKKSNKTSVELGKWKIFDCAQHKAQGSSLCYGINDATIYGFPILLSPENIKSLSQTKDFTKLKPFYLLKDNESIVVFGRTPPPCLYWGFTPYLHKRKYENETTYTQVNASLTDTLNHKRFQKTFNLNSPFDQPIMIIIGKNQGINELIYNKRRFDKLQLDTEIFHKIIIPLPADIMKPDDLITVISRVTYIQPDKGAEYKRNPKLFCFKMTLHENLWPDQAPLYKFRPPVPEPDTLTPAPDQFFQILRDNRIDEFAFMTKSMQPISRVFGDYNKLSASVKRRRVPVSVFSVSLNEPRIPIDLGTTCINNRYDCFYDNRDTVYFVSTPIRTQDALDGIVVMGVNHVNTGKALYTNINIYDGLEFTPLFDLLVDAQKQPTFVKDGVVVKNYTLFYEIFIPYNFYRTHETIFIAERAYLESVVSSSFKTIVSPTIHILPFDKNSLPECKST